MGGVDLRFGSHGGHYFTQGTTRCAERRERERGREGRRQSAGEKKKKEEEGKKGVYIDVRHLNTLQTPYPF